MGQPGERHVRVTADDRADRGIQAGVHLRPPVQAGVDEDDLFVVPGCRVAEQHRGEVADLQGHRLGEAAEEGDLLGPQPPGGQPAISSGVAR